MVGMTNQAGRTEGNFTWNYSIVGQLFHLIVLTPQNLLSFLNAQSFSSSQNYNMCIVVWVATKVTHGPARVQQG